MSEPSVGTRGSYLYLQLSVIFFAIDMASAIIMVFFACLAIDFCSRSFAIPEVCGGIGLLSGFLIRQIYYKLNLWYR
jgi:hypothetical protein